MDTMLRHTVDVLITVLLMGVFLHICYTDIRYRLIRNRDIIIILFITSGVLLLHEKYFNYQYTLIVTAIGSVLVLANIVGAGDIKLLAVLVLSFTKGSLLTYLLLMSFCGVILVLIELLMMKIKYRESRGVPYGVAIISSYLLFFHQEFISLIFQQGVVTGREL